MRMKLSAGAAALALFLAAGQAARADVSIDGAFFDTNKSATGGAALSLGLFKLPVIPLAAELTGAVPFNGDGYATTFDLRFSPFGLTIGAGAGFGNLGQTQTTGAIYDVILAHSLVPHVGIEAREYFGPSRPSTFMVGLRLSL